MKDFHLQVVFLVNRRPCFNRCLHDLHLNLRCLSSAYQALGPRHAVVKKWPVDWGETLGEMSFTVTSSSVILVDDQHRLLDEFL